MMIDYYLIKLNEKKCHKPTLFSENCFLSSNRQLLTKSLLLSLDNRIVDKVDGSR